jgi:hypothetical protein
MRRERRLARLRAFVDVLAAAGTATSSLAGGAVALLALVATRG